MSLKMVCARELFSFMSVAPVCLCASPRDNRSIAYVVPLGNEVQLSVMGMRAMPYHVWTCNHLFLGAGDHNGVAGILLDVYSRLLLAVGVQ